MLLLQHLVYKDTERMFYSERVSCSEMRADKLSSEVIKNAV